MDIFSLFNFLDSWKKSEHKYALCCRKAWAIRMKDKTTESVVEAFEYDLVRSDQVRIRILRI